MSGEPILTPVGTIVRRQVSVFLSDRNAGLIHLGNRRYEVRRLRKAKKSKAGVLARWEIVE